MDDGNEYCQTGCGHDVVEYNIDDDADDDEFEKLDDDDDAIEYEDDIPNKDD